MICNICNSSNTYKKLTIRERDRFEIACGVLKKNYLRFWYKCLNCNSLFNVHKKNNFKKLKKISNNYFKIDFPDTTPLKRFNKIINLPNNKSDNYNRVRRISRFLSKVKKNSKLLDVGAGLGIFLFKLLNFHFKNKKKWKYFSFETDKSNKLLLKKIKGIKNIEKNLFNNQNKFDFITLNKVLEHIENPYNFLRSIKKILSDKGTIYIEVPHFLSFRRKNDNSLVSLHFNLYSQKSLLILIKKLKIKLKQIKRINEPSGKITLFCFIEKI